MPSYLHDSRSLGLHLHKEVLGLKECLWSVQETATIDPAWMMVVFKAQFPLWKQWSLRGLSLGPVAKTLHYQCRRLGFNSWSEDYIPQAATKSWHSQIYIYIKVQVRSLNKDIFIWIVIWSVGTNIQILRLPNSTTNLVVPEKWQVEVLRMQEVISVRYWWDRVTELWHENLIRESSSEKLPKKLCPTLLPHSWENWVSERDWLPRSHYELVIEATSHNWHLRLLFSVTTFWHHINCFHINLCSARGWLHPWMFPPSPAFSPSPQSLNQAAFCLAPCYSGMGTPPVSFRVAVCVFRCSFRKSNPCLVQM